MTHPSQSAARRGWSQTTRSQRWHHGWRQRSTRTPSTGRKPRGKRSKPASRGACRTPRVLHYYLSLHEAEIAKSVIANGCVDVREAPRDEERVAPIAETPRSPPTGTPASATGTP